MTASKRTEYQIKSRKKRDEDGSKIMSLRFTRENVAKIKKYKAEGHKVVDIVNRAVDKF
jgi:hypothetical protein